MQRSISSPVDLLSTIYGLLFATKIVREAKKFFLGYFEPNPWYLDCTGNEDDSMLQAAEEQLSYPGLVRHVPPSTCARLATTRFWGLITVF